MCYNIYVEKKGWYKYMNNNNKHNNKHNNKLNSSKNNKKVLNSTNYKNARENEMHRAEKWSGGQVHKSKKTYTRKPKYRKDYSQEY